MDEAFFENMDRYNPFAFKKSNGKICSYKNYCEAYKAALVSMLSDSKRGYLDIVLYLMRYCGMERRQAVDYLDCFRTTGVLTNSQDDDFSKHGVVMIDWSDEKSLRVVLPRFLQALHLILETNYEQSSFEEAWPWLKKKIKMSIA